MNELNVFQRNAKYLIIFGVIIGSTSGIFARLIDASPMAIGLYRMIFALPFFGLPVLLSAEKRGVLLRYAKKDLIVAFLTALALYFHYICWFKAVKMTTMASAATLESLHPLTVLMVSLLFFKRKVGIKTIVGIAMAIGGSIIVATANNEGVGLIGSSTVGNGLALLSGITLGFYFIFGKVARKNGQRADVFIFVVFLICGLMFAVTMIATKDKFIGYTRDDYIYMFAMAMLCQVGAHALFNWSMAYVSDLYVSTWDTFEGVVGIIIAFFVFSEAPTPIQILGGIVAFGGLLYYNLNSKADWED